MDDINSLLGIDSNMAFGFRLKAQRIIDHQTELQVSASIRCLKHICNHLVSEPSISVSSQSLETVLNKVECEYIKTTSTVSWSTAELRILSYYLIKLSTNESAFLYSIELLRNHWRDIYLGGLSFFLLSSWNNIPFTLRTRAAELLVEKLKNYSGGIDRYMKMADGVDYLCETGPKRLSALLALKQYSLYQAPLALGLRKEDLKLSYFSDTIIHYYSNKSDISVFDIEQILNYHEQPRTTKLVLAAMIKKVSVLGLTRERELVFDLAGRLLGNISKQITWAPFSGATEVEKASLSEAHRIIKQWFTQRIIEVFFDICVQDNARKVFWIDYVSYIDSFKIMGSENTKNILLSDTRIGQQFIPYFSQTTSRSSKTSALVLFIRNKMIVEFSDIGALYVYDSKHLMVDRVLKHPSSITNTNDLKITYMPSLIQSTYDKYYFNHEGRMPHNGDWQERLTIWIKKEILSKPASMSSSVVGMTDTQKQFCDAILADDLTRTKELLEILHTNTNSEIQKKSKQDDSTLLVQDNRYRHNTYESKIDSGVTPKSTSLATNRKEIISAMTIAAERRDWAEVGRLSSMLSKIQTENNVHIKPVVSEPFHLLKGAKFILSTKGLELLTVQNKHYTKLSPLIITEFDGQGTIKLLNKDVYGWTPLIYNQNSTNHLLGYIQTRNDTLFYSMPNQQNNFIKIRL